MIILSGVLVVVAIALLVAGIVAGNGESAQVLGLDALTVIYISIGVSIVSALCLAIGVFLRRKELFGPVAAATPAQAGQPKQKGGRKARRKEAKAAARGGATPPVPVPAPVAPAEADDDMAFPIQPADVPDDALVHVVRGRKRYHLDTCRQLAGRQTEELTYAEAKEEGFSPCTACMPDTALAARAAVSAPAGPASASRSEPGGRSGSAGRGDTATRGGERALSTPPASSPSTGASAGAPTKQPTLDQPYKGKFAKPARAAAAAAPQAPSAWPVPGSTTPPKPEAPERESARPERDPARHAAEAATAPPAEAEPSTPSIAESATEPVRVEEEPLDTPATPRGRHSRKAPDTSGTEEASPSEPATREQPIVESAAASAEQRTREVPAAEPPPASGEEATRETPVAEAEPEPAEEAEPPTAADEPSSSAAPSGAEPQVRILSGTKRYHRPDCALIEDIGDEADDLEALPRSEAKARGCTPCLVCQPDKEHAGDSAS